MQPDFFIIPRVVKHDPKLQPLDGDIYAAIYWLEHLRDGKCKASNRTLAAVVRSTPATVQNSLLRLEAQGYILRVFSDKERKKRSEIKSLVVFSRVPSGSGTLPSGDDTHVPSGDDQSNKVISNKSREISIAIAKFRNHHEVAIYLNQILNDEKTQPHIYLIASFVANKGINPGESFDIKSRRDFSAIVSRNSRTALWLLNHYDLDRIEETMVFLADAPFDWNLESVKKYIAYSPEKIKQSLASMKRKTINA